MPALVHALQAQLAEIGEIAKEVFAALRRHFGHRRPPVIDQTGRQKMLFESDFFDHASPRTLPSGRRGSLYLISDIRYKPRTVQQWLKLCVEERP